MRTKILGVIVLLGLFLRIYQISSVPAGFTPDEASQAYSAYSLLLTGKDEWSIPWPLASFKSFLDYKAPLQTYLMIPSIALFGLNEFATRLPSALFGTLAIIAIYLLTNKLFGDKSLGKTSLNIGHVSALFLAISPWHFQFSRMALEVNLASFLFPLGLYFFLDGLEKPKSFVYTAVLWSFALYSYHAAKLFIPLFALGLLVLFAKDLLKFWKQLLLPLLIVFVIASPLVFSTLFGSSGKRGADLLITNLTTPEVDLIHNQIAYSTYRTPSFLTEMSFHNRAVVVISKFFENYLSYFSLPFWFTEGGREITYSVIPGRGLLYFWQLPLILIAIAVVLMTKTKRSLKVIAIWFLLAAIPAAVTREGYRPNRAGSFAVLFEILSALGFVWFIAQENISRIIKLGFVSIALVLTVFYFEDYFSASLVKYPTSLSYGWRDAINFTNEIQDEYDIIQIEQGTQPQSFVAFYTQLDPTKFHRAALEWDKQISEKKDLMYLDQLGDYSLEKYWFKNFSWPEHKNKNTLYISQTLKNLPEDRSTVYIVKGQDDKPIMELFDFR